ncbi:YesL family protein [Niallia sp. Krafla_26]|uniref:YesL family protein n=1 Tax=Niallia sp. Krafla_26 TaxID=3064703 RepID=UPI003D174A2C
MQAFNEKFNHFGEWVIRLVFLNFLWMGFSVLGLGILGIFPATSALFSVMRKWFIGNDRVKIVSEFFRYYKKDFWKSNLLGYFFLLVAIILWADYQFVSSIANLGMLALGYIVLILLAFSLLSLFILFPIYSHYQLSLFQYIKNTILFPITNLFSMILLAALFFVIQFIFSQLPGFILFIGMSFPAFVMMKLVFPIFQGKSLSVRGFFKMFKKSREESLYY